MVMHGKWKKALARIVESPDAPAGATEPTWGHAREFHEYLVEVSTSRQTIQGTVGMTSLFIHAVGEPMAVEVNLKTGEVRIDKLRMSEMLSQQAQSLRTDAWMARQAQAGGGAQGGVAGPSLGASGPAPTSPSPGRAGDPSGSAEERLARLQQLHDKGLLTESEYQAKREQIIGEI